MTEFLYQKFDLFDRSPIESFNPAAGQRRAEAEVHGRGPELAVAVPVEAEREEHALRVRARVEVLDRLGVAVLQSGVPRDGAVPVAQDDLGTKRLYRSYRCDPERRTPSFRGSTPGHSLIINE